MDIQVISDEKKPLLKRREITARLGYDDKTPSRLEIRRSLAKKLGVKEELVVVTRIKPYYGTPAADLEVAIYDDESALKELEPDYMIKRHLPKEEKEERKEEGEEEKKAGEKKEKPGEEGKAEEKKEEAKEEKKVEEKKEEAKEEKKAEGKKEDKPQPPPKKST